MSQFSKWRMTPSSLFRLTLALLIALFYAYGSRAQELTVPDEDADELVINAEPQSAAVGAALASINARNPETPLQWIQAVITLRRMGAYDEAQSFLDRALAQTMSQDEQIQLYEAIGTADLVALSIDTNLPTARAFVFSVFAAVKADRRNADRLAGYLEKLTDDDESVRTLAMANLAQAESYAAAAVVKAIRSGDSKIDLRLAEAALVQLGSNAEEPMLALIGAPDPVLQAIAARVLGQLASKRASLHLIRPYFVGADGARQAAADVFQKIGRVPGNIVAASELLIRKAEYHLDGNPPVRADIDGTLEMWTWNAEQDNIVPVTLTARQAGAVVAARYARDAYELNPTRTASRMLLVTRLEVDQSLSGLDQSLPKGPGTAHQIGVSSGVDVVCDALGYSLRHHHVAAAIGACELIQHHCQNASVSTRWSPLIRALQNSNRRVRHAAVRAIMKIDPRQRYVGASFFLEALTDLANASGGPHAIVGMPRRKASDSVSGLLSSLGFSVSQTNEGRPLLQLATASSDLDVVFLSDSVSFPMASETIQQLRKHPHTKDVPVVLMQRNLPSRAAEIASQDKLTFILAEFSDIAALMGVLEQAEAASLPTSVPPTIRLEQAKDAIGWLTHLAQYSQTYPWYDIQRAEEAAMQAARQPGLSQSAVSLLGYLGGARAQHRLVELASQKDESLAARQRAATAFTEAVVRRGLMLKSADVSRQYSRYNASETDDVEVQEILGQVLDVIESQTKPTSTTAPVSF